MVIQSVYITGTQNSETYSSDGYAWKIAEKPDKNGNMWTYYIFRTANYEKYLGVRDEQRGYERVYRIAGGGYSEGAMSGTIEELLSTNSNSLHNPEMTQ